MANERVVPEINLALCNRCGACLFSCPVHAVEMGPDGPFIARPQDCTYCAECETYCPTGAIAAAYEIVWGLPEGGR
ncbi:MAG: 4Fe-4S binding protein [Anaerolineae bacterium]|nr:4Fe-4S binding protein [Anaerolineae bacterium]